MLYLNLIVGERYKDLEKTATLHQHKLSKYLESLVALATILLSRCVTRRV